MGRSADDRGDQPEREQITVAELLGRPKPLRPRSRGSALSVPLGWSRRKFALTAGAAVTVSSMLAAGAVVATDSGSPRQDGTPAQNPSTAAPAAPRPDERPPAPSPAGTPPPDGPFAAPTPTSAIRPAGSSTVVAAKRPTTVRQPVSRRPPTGPSTRKARPAPATPTRAPESDTARGGGGVLGDVVDGVGDAVNDVGEALAPADTRATDPDESVPAGSALSSLTGKITAFDADGD